MIVTLRVGRVCAFIYTDDDGEGHDFYVNLDIWPSVRIKYWNIYEFDYMKSKVVYTIYNTCRNFFLFHFFLTIFVYSYQKKVISFNLELTSLD